MNGLQNDSHPGGGEPGPLRAGSGRSGLAAGRPAVPGWGAPGGPCFAPAARAPSPRGAPAPGVGRQRAPRPPGAQFLFRTSPRPASGRARAPWPVRGARHPGAGGDQCPTPSSPTPPLSFFFLCWPRRRGPGRAALRSGPMPRGPGSPASEGEGRRGAGCPARGSDGPPHCTDAETEAPRVGGCQDRPPGSWSPPTPASEGAVSGPGPQTSPASK